jgi:hypothetical protein
VPKKQKRRDTPDRPSRSSKARAAARSEAPAGGMPTREQLLDYLGTTTDKVG